MPPVGGPAGLASGLRTPRRCWPATSMFSMTVSRGKIRLSWKVRPMPRPNTFCGEALVIFASRA